MEQRGYQLNFSHKNDAMFDAEGRIMKSKKVLEILHDYLGSLSNLSHLDVGCSTGFMTCLYSKAFKSSVGVDIDAGAIDFASKNNSAENLKYFVRDAMDTGFSDNSFDVVTCSHIYEHVPNAERLVKEIYRVLTPGGICFFAAGNRFVFWEGHYHLPLLATVPKPLAHLYLRVTGKGTHYYETHFSYWGLKRLVSQFEIVDYTSKVIQDPVSFSATDLVNPGSFKQTLALNVLKTAYWLFPTYLWLLKKQPTQSKISISSS
jgi:2-polyprenyl-3-methyl-5-hydroxy-6-metoxy-1,4-benzoquinol methylase